jgi:hypothetical protein
MLCGLLLRLKPRARVSTSRNHDNTATDVAHRNPATTYWRWLDAELSGGRPRGGCNSLRHLYLVVDAHRQTSKCWAGRYDGYGVVDDEAHMSCQ